MAEAALESYPPLLDEELDHLTFEWANRRPARVQAGKYDVEEVT